MVCSRGCRQGRAHRKPALVELLLAIELDQLAAHLLGEVVRLGDQGPAVLDDAQRLGPGLLGLILVDQPVVEHTADHPVAPGHRRFGPVDRVVVVRRLRQRRQIGGLGQGQLVERLVEVVERRGGDPVGAEAEIDLAQVELEDALLGEGPLDAEGQDRLADLALDLQLVAEQEVLRHLLGDGRGADRPLVLDHVEDVGHRRARDRQEIEAVVIVEVLVLGGDEGVDDPFRDHLDRHEDPLFDGELGQDAPVAGVHAGHRRRVVVRKLIVIRQIAPVDIEHVDHADAAGDRQDQRQREQRGKQSHHLHSESPDPPGRRGA
jgi:hypothetical protein